MRSMLRRMTDALPTYRLDGTTAVITLDDGKANAFSSAVVARLEAGRSAASEEVSDSA